MAANRGESGKINPAKTSRDTMRDTTNFETRKPDQCFIVFAYSVNQYIIRRPAPKTKTANNPLTATQR